VGTSATAVAAHEADARRDLTAAEQGLYADLRIAADELHEDTLSIKELAGLGIAPFVADMSQARRGGHVWQRLERGSFVGYLGISGEPAVAGALLLVVERHRPDSRASIDAHASHISAASVEALEPDIWLHRGERVSPPERFDAGSLARAGWRRIVAQFDAGVTRQRRAGPTP